jgi:glutamate-5-semialdehyde dehydrogenase
MTEMNPIDIPVYVAEVGQRARTAARDLARASTAARNAALLAAAEALRRETARLQSANAHDLDAARAAGHDAAFVDRLALTDSVIESMALGLEQIAALPDPVGEIANLRISR